MHEASVVTDAATVASMAVAPVAGPLAEMEKTGVTPVGASQTW